MNLRSKTPRIELLLQPHEMLTLDNRQREMAVACKNGIVWVTCAGDHEDHILSVGSRYIPETKGRIVIEAIGESCVDIEENR